MGIHPRNLNLGERERERELRVLLNSHPKKKLKRSHCRFRPLTKLAFIYEAQLRIISSPIFGLHE